MKGKKIQTNKKGESRKNNGIIKKPIKMNLSYWKDKAR